MASYSNLNDTSQPSFFDTPRPKYSASQQFFSAVESGMENTFGASGSAIVERLAIDSAAWDSQSYRYSKEEWEQKYPSLPWDENTNTDVHLDYLLREQYKQRLGALPFRGGIKYAPYFAGSILGSVLHPVDLALMFATGGESVVTNVVNGVRKVQLGATAARAAMIGIRDAALMEPMMYAGERARLHDYGIQDSIFNVGFSGVFSGLLGAAPHVYGRFREKLPSILMNDAISGGDGSLVGRMATLDPEFYKVLRNHQNMAKASVEGIDGFLRLSPEQQNAVRTYAALADGTRAEIDVMSEHIRLKDIKEDSPARGLGMTAPEQATFKTLSGLSTAPEQMGKEHQRVARLFRQVFGTDVRFVSTDVARKHGFEGRTYMSNPGTVFVHDRGANAAADMLRIGGHELAHSLKFRSPQVFAGLLQFIATNPEAKKAFGQAYGRIRSDYPAHVWEGLSPERHLDEAVAELVGNSAQHMEFWKAAGRMEPNLLSQVAQWFRGLLARVQAAFGSDPAAKEVAAKIGGILALIDPKDTTSKMSPQSYEQQMRDLYRGTHYRYATERDERGRPVARSFMDRVSYDVSRANMGVSSDIAAADRILDDLTMPEHSIAGWQEGADYIVRSIPIKPGWHPNSMAKKLLVDSAKKNPGTVQTVNYRNTGIKDARGWPVVDFYLHLNREHFSWKELREGPDALGDVLARVEEHTKEFKLEDADLQLLRFIFNRSDEKKNTLNWWYKQGRAQGDTAGRAVSVDRFFQEVDHRQIAGFDDFVGQYKAWVLRQMEDHLTEEVPKKVGVEWQPYAGETDPFITMLDDLVMESPDPKGPDTKWKAKVKAVTRAFLVRMNASESYAEGTRISQLLDELVDDPERIAEIPDPVLRAQAQKELKARLVDYLGAAELSEADLSRAREFITSGKLDDFVKAQYGVSLKDLDAMDMIHESLDTVVEPWQTHGDSVADDIIENMELGASFDEHVANQKRIIEEEKLAGLPSGKDIVGKYINRLQEEHAISSEWLDMNPEKAAARMDKAAEEAMKELTGDTAPVKLTDEGKERLAKMEEKFVSTTGFLRNKYGTELKGFQKGDSTNLSPEVMTEISKAQNRLGPTAPKEEIMKQAMKALVDQPMANKRMKFAQQELKYGRWLALSRKGLNFIQSRMDGIMYKGVTGAGDSIAALKKTRANQVLNPITSWMDSMNLRTMWQDGSLSRAVLATIDGVNVPTAPGSKALLDELANIIKLTKESQVARANRAGAMITLRQGHGMVTVHDPARIRRQKGDWRQYLVNNLDWEKIDEVRGPSGVDQSKIPKFLDAVFEDILNNHWRDGDSFDPEIHGGDPGGRMSASRTLVFKPGAQFDYDMRFGTGDTPAAILAQIARREEDIVIMEEFGDHKALWSRLRDEANINRGTLRDGLDGWTLEQTYKHLTGQLDNPVNRNWAAVGQMTRAITNSAMLWKTSISSILDVGSTVSAMRWMGQDTKTSMMTVLGAMKNAYQRDTKGPAAIWLRGQGAGLSAIMGAYTRLAGNENTASSLARKINEFTFKWNGMNLWTRTLHEATADLMTQHLGKMAEAEKLTPEFLGWLQNYNISEAEFRSMAKHAGEIPGLEGKRLGVDQVDDPALRNKLGVAIDDTMRYAVLEPSVSDEALLRMGTPAGTPTGEAFRCILQYKSYPLALLRKVNRRFINGYGDQGLFSLNGGFMNRARTEKMAFLSMAFTLGTISLAIKDILRGREPILWFDPEQFTAANFARTLEQAGTFGLLNDVLSPEGILGPSFGAAYAVVTAPGKPNGFYQGVNAAMSMTPGATLPLVDEGRKAVLATIFHDSYGIWYQAMLRRVEAKQGQTSVYLDENASRN